MERVVTLVVVVLAVVMLATVATSLDTVSTQTSIESESDGTGPQRGGSSGGASGGGSGTVDGGVEFDLGSTSTSTSTGDTTTMPLWQVVGGVGLVLLGGLVALYGLTSGMDQEEPIDADFRSTAVRPTAASVTLSSDTDLSNDIYRSWNTLCQGVPTETTGRTPARVAEAAVDAGYDSEAVTELTALFCAVRYGQADPTNDRERRARELASNLSLTMQEGDP